MKLEEILNVSKRHSLAVIAQVVPTAPFMTLADVAISGNTADQSLKARLVSLGITVLGASLYDRGREQYLKWSGAEEGKNANTKTAIRDASLNGAMFGLGALISYSLAGVDDVSTLAYNVLTTGAIGTFTGPLVGRATDILKDWFEIEPCPRLPLALRNRTLSQKMTLTTSATAASLALTISLAYMNESNKNLQPLSYQQNP